MKTVYTCFCTDVIHEGHLNIIRQASKYGEVVIGVLSDEASGTSAQDTAGEPCDRAKGGHVRRRD